MISISTDITWKKGTNSEIKFSDGHITITGESVVVKCRCNGSEFKQFTSSYPAYKDIHAGLLKTIEYSNTRLNNKTVAINFNNAIVTKFMSHWSGNDNTLQWEMSNIEMKYTTETPIDYYIISLPYIYLWLQIHECVSDEDDKFIDLTFGNHSFEVTPATDPNYAILKAKSKHADLNGFLSLLSFYTGSDVAIVANYKVDGNAQIVDCIPQGQPNKEYNNYELGFLNLGRSNTLQGFLAHNSWPELDKKAQVKLSSAIYTYTKSKSLDYCNQFLLEYSILDRFFIEQRKNPYICLKDALDKYNIDIGKIGKTTDTDINRLSLTLERNSKDRKVQNFCDLRDYILHFMYDPKIDDYLSKSDLVSNLRFAVAIIILKELGIHDISFKDDWQHLSIMKKS